LFAGKIEAKLYDPSNIQFDCLKDSIDHYESKHGKFSDYGLKYIAYFARACEIELSSTIKGRIDSSLGSIVQN
jgi:hypothetical protein